MTHKPVWWVSITTKSQHHEIFQGDIACYRKNGRPANYLHLRRLNHDTQNSLQESLIKIVNFPDEGLIKTFKTNVLHNNIRDLDGNIEPRQTLASAVKDLGFR